MIRIGCIVEGQGEVQAVPVLLRRMLYERHAGVSFELLPPLRGKRSRLVLPGELERAVDLLASLVGPDGRMLVLLDADEDCPKELAPHLLGRARRARPDRCVEVVLATMEFENWFHAALTSLRGVRGLPMDVEDAHSPEMIRGAKERLVGLMGYSPTIDQAALTARMDLERARRAPSFDKLCRAVEALIAG
ncbi:MAG: DUF4276 family protein [Planctomycetes bacterium]|nr:DUF4276 family protein [Planctomycetota bacterium]